jgi:DNA polymerase III subunit delta
MSGVVLLLCGEDDFAISQRLREIEGGYGNESERQFSVSRLDGSNISLEELKRVLYSMPLFASRRLVVLSRAAGHFQPQPARKQFLDMIAGMPESAELVLVEPQKIAADHWLIRWFKENERQDSVTVLSLRKGPDMEKFIQEQVKQAGGKISNQAVALLSGLVVDDSRLAHQEVNKLLTYVNYARRVEAEDVESISVSVAQGNVFGMVDALGTRDGRNAAALLYQLLEERDALSLFQMIVRQFRMILVARELMDSGGKVSDLMSYFRTPEFVAKKVWSQARQFSMSTIVDIFHRLLELDDVIKTGGMEDSLALETFVADFTSSSVKAFH